MKTKLDFLKMKESEEPIVMLTAYDYPAAKLAEQAGVDMILVGDSLGMVVLGLDSTVGVTVADMIHHTKAVKRGAPNTFIVTDMPFMSYHLSKEDTLKNAAAIVQESGADALKLEGGEGVFESIRALTLGGIPVVSHLGLTPQSVGVLGGYKVQGKDEQSAKKINRRQYKMRRSRSYDACAGMCAGRTHSQNCRDAKHTGHWNRGWCESGRTSSRLS